jgi:hypothetical protein
MNSPAQMYRAKRIAGMTAATLAIVAIATYTFAAWLKPSTLLALLTTFAFCG